MRKKHPQHRKEKRIVHHICHIHYLLPSPGCCPFPHAALATAAQCRVRHGTLMSGNEATTAREEGPPAAVVPRVVEDNICNLPPIPPSSSLVLFLPYLHHPTFLGVASTRPLPPVR
ncbi:hypothetical protein E2C01_039176 [Portunus trituberculatus]|uniref:Uncharacterized protein n=1 Tax=Portunus trituberculatus TaxID=210409 RepID=A0A5B7FIY0_PORTR|nr:hypothetical protein [Portunus trituberculatus]